MRAALQFTELRKRRLVPYARELEPLVDPRNTFIIAVSVWFSSSFVGRLKSTPHNSCSRQTTVPNASERSDPHQNQLSNGRDCGATQFRPRARHVDQPDIDRICRGRQLSSYRNLIPYSTSTTARPVNSLPEKHPHIPVPSANRNDDCRKYGACEVSKDDTKSTLRVIGPEHASAPSSLTLRQAQFFKFIGFTKPRPWPPAPNPRFRLRRW